MSDNFHIGGRIVITRSRSILRRKIAASKGRQDAPQVEYGSSYYLAVLTLAHHHYLDGEQLADLAASDFIF